MTLMALLFASCRKTFIVQQDQNYSIMVVFMLFNFSSYRPVLDSSDYETNFQPNVIDNFFQVHNNFS